MFSSGKTMTIHKKESAWTRTDLRALKAYTSFSSILFDYLIMILMIAIFIISHVCEQPTEWIAQLCFMVRHKNQDCVYLGVWIVWVILYSHFGDKLRTAKYWAQLHMPTFIDPHQIWKSMFYVECKNQESYWTRAVQVMGVLKLGPLALLWVLWNFLNFRGIV